MSSAFSPQRGEKVAEGRMRGPHTALRTTLSRKREKGTRYATILRPASSRFFSSFGVHASA
jgi:hypothetical protein